MANEARLNLVITAQDQARSVIEEFAAGIQETFARLQEEMSKAFNMSEIESTIGEAMATIQRDVSEVNIGTVLEEQFSTLNKSVEESLKSVEEGFTQMVQSATRAGEDMSRAFNMSSVEATVGEAMSAIQRDVAGANLSTALEEQFREMVTATEESTSEIRNVFDSMDSGFSQLTQAVGETTRVVQEGFTQMAEDATRAADEMNVSMDTMGHSVGNMEQMMAAQMIGEQLTQIGEAGKSGFEEAINSASDFEFNMSRVGAVLTTVGKASNSQMSQMAEMALQLGSHSSFSANQIAEGMYVLSRQGLDAATIMGDGVNGAINIVNDLAQATDSSMTDTATVITDVIHEYGLSGSELRNVANIMSGTLHNSSESLTDLYYSMRQVGPVASSMHQSVEDVSTTLAILAQRGITGSAAGTAVKNMLLGLEPRTKKAAELMKELGISAKQGAADSFYQLNGNLKPMPEIIDILNQKFGGLNDKQKQAALAATFTKYGLAGLNTIVGESRDKFMAFQKELKMDDAATIAHKKYDNLHGDFIKLGAATQTMAKAFGDTLAPALRGAVQAVTQIVAWITALPKPVKEAGIVALGLASALFIVAGTLINTGIALAMMKPGLIFLAKSFGLAEFSIAGVTRAMLATLGPIALAVAAVALLAFAGYELYTHWAQVKAWLIGIWNAIYTTATSVFNNVKSFLESTFNSIVSTATSTWNNFSNGIRNTWNSVVSWIKGAAQAFANAIVEAFQWMYNHNYYFKDLVDFIRNAWTSIQNNTRAAWSAITSALTNAWNTMSSTAHSVWSAISSFLTSLWNSIVSTARSLWTGLSSFLSSLWHSITSAVSSAWNAIVSTITGKTNQAISAVKGPFQSLGSFFSGLYGEAEQWGANLINMMANGIRSAAGAVGNAVKSVASSISSFLGFHSPTKEGPGADSDKWMPNMINMFTEGIQQHAPKLQMAISNVALGLKTGTTQMGNTINQNHISIPSNRTASAGGTNIYISIDGRSAKTDNDLAEIIAHKIYRQMPVVS